MTQCCDRDHDGDGNCDLHGDGNLRPEEDNLVMSEIVHRILLTHLVPRQVAEMCLAGHAGAQDAALEITQDLIQTFGEACFKVGSGETGYPYQILCRFCHEVASEPHSDSCEWKKNDSLRDHD